jgi:pyruvate/2-oxoglutarate dehydrogenase complex dihydrolipoamide dehydrogenase (E3) component
MDIVNMKNYLKNEFDVAVIGGGAAGLVTAKITNAFNLKTCIIEKEKIGGCCTWTGCIPSKVLLNSAQICAGLTKLSTAGISLTGKFTINTSDVLNHVRKIVQKVAQNHEPEDLEKSGIKIIFGTPAFINSNTIEIDKKIKITAKKYIICTGSQPVIPPIKGIDSLDYYTNEDFFTQKELPKSMLVVGGGPIGVELSYAMQVLGTKVTIIEMADHILPREDIESTTFINNELLAKGAVIKTGAQVIEFRKSNNRMIEAILKNHSGEQKIVSAEKLLLAIGRKPNFNGLALENAQVKYDKHGIKTNKFLQTTNKNIFACGDVVGPYYFSHVAAYQAAICARNAIFKRIIWQKFDYSNICWATFTQPELAHLGFYEEEAKEKHKHIKIYKTEYVNADRAYTDDKMNGLVKVIADKKNHILGADIVGDLAGEIIQGLLIAKANNISLAKLTQTMFIYPTLSELIYKTARKSFIEKKDKPLIKLLLRLLSEMYCFSGIMNFYL